MKQYKAVSDSICISQFKNELEEGWYSSSKEALLNFKSADNMVDTVDSRTFEDQQKATVKRRGRPSKE